MEDSAPETVAPDNSGEELAMGEIPDVDWESIEQYVLQNKTSTNTKLFSILALLNAYVPESYLLMSECEQILGPPDPIFGGPPFDERMEPFTACITASDPDRVCMIDPKDAKHAVSLLAELQISRSETMKTFMISLCGAEPHPHTVQFVKDLLTKREETEQGKARFSSLIEDIESKERNQNAVSVLEMASGKFINNPIYPQTLSRFYINTDKENAEKWAKIAIAKAPNNSYVADTLGQVYKSCLWTVTTVAESGLMVNKALGAFKDVENKADRELGQEMMDTEGTESISSIFNNRGLFGFVQVAKIVYWKFPNLRARILITEVEDKFNFFEWYLTYSKPDMTTVEPHYFWKDVVYCFERYTNKKAAESTSFPALLDCLNHSLFLSKEQRANLEKTERDLEDIQSHLKTTYEENVDDVKAAEKYILSNVILSNKRPDSPLLAPVAALQQIIQRFLEENTEGRSPPFYLLLLMLFWPEEQPQVVQKEEEEDEEEMAQQDSGLEDTTWDEQEIDEEQETGGETADLIDLQQHVAKMEEAFERVKYGKYLRGRYLVPLFFLGKGCGLGKWIHKSKLDVIVEEKVDAELAELRDGTTKVSRINKMWSGGEVWHIPQIQDILLPVNVEPCQPLTTTQQQDEQEVFVHVRGKKIKAKTEVEPDDPVQSPMRFYLGFNIKGPVVFKVGPGQMSE